MNSNGQKRSRRYPASTENPEDRYTGPLGFSNRPQPARPDSDSVYDGHEQSEGNMKSSERAEEADNSTAQL